MHGLCQCNQNRGHTKLLISEVFHDVRVESENTKFVDAHNSSKKLHEENFMVQGEAFIIVIEDIVKLLGECLRVVQELECRKVWCVLTFLLLSLFTFVRKKDQSRSSPGLLCLQF